MLGRSMVDTTEVVNSKDLIDWYISHAEFVSVNDVLWEYNDRKKK